MEHEHVMVTSSNCNDCAHKSVCSYKQDYIDICNSIARTNIYKHMDDGTVKVTNAINYTDILGEIVIRCKHFSKVASKPCYPYGLSANDYNTVSTPNTATLTNAMETTS